MFSRLKFWLVVGLLASNLTVGLLSLYFLNSINDRYSTLLDRSVPLIGNLRTLTRELGAVQRMARRVIDPQNEPGWAALVEQMDRTGNTARARALNISAMPLLQESRHVSSIMRLSREYDVKADAFLELIRAGKFSEARTYNADVLRPAYESYMATLDSVALYVEQQGNTLRAGYEEDSRFFSRLLLVFAAWPVIAVLLGGLVLLLLVLALIISVFAPGLAWRKTETLTSP